MQLKALFAVASRMLQVHIRWCMEFRGNLLQANATRTGQLSICTEPYFELELDCQFISVH